MLQLKEFLNTLSEKQETFCCRSKNNYGVEVSYKENVNETMSRDINLRIMGQYFNGEETASDYIDNIRAINFNFENLKDFKDFVNEALINNFDIEFITKNKNVIWSAFKQL